MLVILKIYIYIYIHIYIYINKRVIGKLNCRLETIPYSISPINKPQGGFAVNTDANESEWGKLIEQTPLHYFDLCKAPCDRL